MFDDMDFFSDDKPSVEKDIDIEPKSGGVFSDFNFFEDIYTFYIILSVQ